MSKPPADHSMMRGLNRTLVLDVLKDHSPLSRASIAKATTLAKPTVSAIVEDLVREGVIKEVGPGSTSPEGGRPPMLLEFDARSQFVVGVHLGIRQTTLVVTDAQGAEVGRLGRPTALSDATSSVRLLAEEIEEVLTTTSTPKQLIAAVGICVPGLVEPSTGTVLLAPNLGWRDVSLKSELEQLLDIPVFVHNTAQASAVAESVEGAGEGASNLVFLYAGTGVGAGILIDGHIYHGGAGIAGEIGHCRVPGAERLCNCGLTGCLETVASGPAIAQAAAGLFPDGVTAEIVSAAAAAGDERARAIIEQAGMALGTAASWLINLFNPEVVVIGGGLIGAGDALLEPLRRAAIGQSLPQATDGLVIRPSTLGQQAEVRGAVLVALQHSESHYRLMFQT